MFDVAIVGGGPAGSTAGRLLAQWGYSVLMLAAPPGRRALAECLPPSHRKLFRFLGIEEAIDRAGFFRTTGNTVWWGGQKQRVEAYPAGWGYQVARADFDRLLLNLAKAAGAQVKLGKVDARAEIPAQFLLDCSGRAGVLSRGLRVRQKGSATVALCGIWRSEKGWSVPDDSHTLVEQYGENWAWSVPLSPNLRYVAFMVDPRRGKDYRAELAKTRAFRRIFSRGTLESPVWGRDASLYTSRSFFGPNFLPVGDAGSFIDPLSSFGIRKAMASAWAAAVVANTWLQRPAMRDTALRYFDQREREIYESYLRQSESWHEGKRRDPDPPKAPLRAVSVRRAEGVRAATRAGIEGREVVLREALVAPGSDTPFDFLNNVNVPRLVEMAGRHSRVPELFDCYNRNCPPVPLDDFLAAISGLLESRILMQ